MERGAGGPAQRTARSRAVGGSRATAPPSAGGDPDGPRVPPPSPGTTDAPRRRWGENRERPEGNCHKGYHPVTGLLVRSCCCPSPAACREVMWHYAATDDGDACQYLFLPGHPKKEDSENGKHVIQFRDNVFRHLFGSGAHSAKEKWKGKKCYVAFHHFPPPIRRLLPSFGKGLGTKKIDLFRIPESVARECGLTDADLCKTSGTISSDKTYFPSPNVPMRESVSFVAAAEGGRSVLSSASHDASPDAPSSASRASQNTEGGFDSSHASSNAPSSASRASQNTEGGSDSSVPPSHETPRERQRERIARAVAENPMAAAKLIQEQHDEIKALKEQLIEQNNDLAKRRRWS